jgi:hypothetical protein
LPTDLPGSLCFDHSFRLSSWSFGRYKRDMRVARCTRIKPSKTVSHDCSAAESGRTILMGAASMLDRTIRATLCEIERGLFHARYRSTDPLTRRGESVLNHHYLPIYQVAPCAADAMKEIEATARAGGYDAVVWEDALPAPAISPPVYGRDSFSQGSRSRFTN